MVDGRHQAEPQRAQQKLAAAATAEQRQAKPAWEELMATTVYGALLKEESNSVKLNVQSHRHQLRRRAGDNDKGTVGPSPRCPRALLLVETLVELLLTAKLEAARRCAIRIVKLSPASPPLQLPSFVKSTAPCCNCV